jgi:hypothetical protein
VKGLLDLGGMKAATFGVGDSIGLPEALSKYIVAHGGKPMKVLTLVSSTGDFAPTVVAGQADTTIDPVSHYQPFVDAHKLKTVPGLEPGSKLMNELVPKNVVGQAFIGYSDVLKSKNDAIVRMVAGMRLADRWMAAHSPEDIAKDLDTFQGFKAQPAAVVLLGVKAVAPFWNQKGEGFIEPDAWAASQKAWSTWNTGVTTTSSQFGYDKVVDMSFWNAATPLVNKLSGS